MSHDKSIQKFLCIKRKNGKDLKVVCVWPGSCKVSECFLIGRISFGAASWNEDVSICISQELGRNISLVK